MADLLANCMGARLKRIRELLREHLPALSAHLDDLQVDLACVSQWLLSLFAVTCPLPMLFRTLSIYNPFFFFLVGPFHKVQGIVVLTTGFQESTM